KADWQGAAKGDMSRWMPIRVETETVTRAGVEPASSYEVTFPQSVLWGFFGVVNTFAIGMVFERRSGTLLRLQIAPLAAWQRLGGKMAACFAAFLVIALFLLSFGHFAFGIRIQDPFGLVIVILAIALCFSGITMLISTCGNTERAVAGMASG